MPDQEEIAAIPLVEERIAVSRKQVETGRLRVRVAVDERVEDVPVELSHDEVEIRRVPRNVAVSAIPGVRIEGNTTVIPVVEEVVVVEKRLMLVEEIHVQRRTAAATEHVAVTVRSERAEIEREGEVPTGVAGGGEAS